MEAGLLSGRIALRHLVALLEEPSAALVLKAVLPSILPQDVRLQCISFEGKRDFENNIEMKIRNWRLPDTKFLLMRDRDSEDCHEVKKRLVATCQNAGRKDALVRIACGELESFYLGDLKAVAEAFGRKMPSQNLAKFRDPDHLGNAAEELGRILSSSEQKLKWARAISPHLALDGSNRSHSFNVLISGVRKLFPSNQPAPNQTIKQS